jgi:HAD superfamily hydrolase (TIGR01509 family)
VTALILDCDGVLAETERHLHLPAFNRSFAELGVGLAWSEAEYVDRLGVGGGRERIEAALTRELLERAGFRPDAASRTALAARLHARKTELFDEVLAAADLPPRPGVVRLLGAAAAAGWRLAVASTAAEPSVRAVMARTLGPGLAAQIAVFAGDLVVAKKPDPAIYELAVERLGVGRADAVVVEDSRNGMLAATGAGLTCVVTLSELGSEDDFSGAALVLTSLGDPEEPLAVIANPSGIPLGSYLTLPDLEALLEARTTVGRGDAYPR